MTALQPARHEPSGGPPTATARQPVLARVPFPVVDEIARHCLQDDEPETVHIEVHLPGRVDPARLRAAFHQALTRHPRVLMRQAPVRRWCRRYEWELTAAPDVDPVVFPPPGPDALVRARERALAGCPPLDASPPVRLEVIERPGAADGTVLFLAINHTALDGPACLRVLATAAELYGGADNSPAPPPVRATGPAGDRNRPGDAAGPGHGLARPARLAPDHTPNDRREQNQDHEQDPSQRQEHSHAQGVGHDRERSRWQEHSDLIQPPTNTAINTGTKTGTNPLTDNGMLITELPVPARPPRVDGRARYTVNDQLLVATCLMAARWNRLHDVPASPVVVTMPVDDRPRGADMPIGNGTRLVSVGFGPEERRDAELLTADPPDPGAVARLLRRTAARTRALKSTTGSQLGLAGALLTAPVLPVGLRGAVTRALRTVAAPWTSTTLLSNIGRIPYPLDFGDAGRPTAVWFSAPARMPRGLTVTTVSVGGRVQLALRWSHALLDDAAGARLGELFESSLAATAWAPPPTPPAPRAEGGAR
ncbi:condensation protein [Streptomyces halobius]|uniref:Condensation protein n=1 Tax=Streptomyces halobius TaxID=2879846 RepID=A0ABY4MGT6_9ACTN|nr:condensation protein [Streptomyces halobius]UQA95536.1 condensation protein [Streptomyces halobius]